MKQQSKIWRGVTAVIMAFVMVLVACSASQIQQAVNGAVIALEIAKDVFPEAHTLVAEISIGNPVLGGQLSLLEAQAEKAVDTLIATGKDFLSKPSDSTYQTLLNGVTSIISQANAETLKQVHISNPDTQRKVQAWLAAFVTAMKVIQTLLQVHANAAQKKAVPVAAASLDELRPYLDHEYASRLLDRMGYPGEAVVLAMGF